MKRPARTPETTPVIVACCRTAIGRSHPERGLFRHVRGDELAAAVIRKVVESSRVDPDTIEIRLEDAGETPPSDSDNDQSLDDQDPPEGEEPPEEESKP